MAGPDRGVCDGGAAEDSRAGSREPGARRKAASPGETVENWLIRNRPDGDDPRDALESARARRVESAARQGRRAALRACAGGDVRRRPASRRRRAADEAAAPGVRGTGARIRRKPRRRSADRHHGESASIDGYGVTVEADGERWTPGAVISSVPWYALPGARSRAVPAALAKTIERASAHGIVADRDREPLVRPAGGLTSRFSGCPGVRCSGSSINGSCSAAVRRTCRSCRAAPVLSCSDRTRTSSPSRIRNCSTRLPEIRAARLAARDRHPRAQRHVFTRARAARTPPHGDRCPTLLPGRRLDRHRPARHDRVGGPLGK